MLGQFNDSELRPYALVGDELADNVVKDLDLKPGSDSLEIIKQNLASENPLPSVVEFWKSVNRLPVGASTSQELKSSLSDGNSILEPTLANGMGVFWKFVLQILDSLLHYSLAVGFSSPFLVHVLEQTNYLTGPNRDVTFRRLNETCAWVFDAMTDMTPGSGVGWESTVRVRCLHAQVRRRILRKGASFDIEKWGTPINQRDMAATLAGFMIVPIWAMKRIGVNIRQDQINAYHAAWCHIGYYIGISEDLLARYRKSWGAAESFFISLTVDIFPDESAIPAETTENVLSILKSVVMRPPEPYNLERHIALTRAMAGNIQADVLRLPQSSYMDRAFIYSRLQLKKFLLWYGSCRPEWEVRRQVVLQHALPLYALRVLGHYKVKAGSRRPKANPYARQVFPLQDIPHDYSLDKNNPLDEVEEGYRQEYIRLVKSMLREIALTSACALTFAGLTIVFTMKRS